MFYVSVHLFGNGGSPGEFREYEGKVLDIFKRYGGEILIAFAPTGSSDGGESPDEIQILRIPDRAGFDAFMKDPERVGLAAERARVIRKTEVFFSGDIIQY